jgi:hypothetical protein
MLPGDVNQFVGQQQRQLRLAFQVGKEPRVKEYGTV